MKKYCVIGENVDNSLSPLMHNTHFQTLGIDAHYISVSFDNLEDNIEYLKQFDGFNITMPYKEMFIEHLDYIDNSVKRVNAVNCVKVVDGKLYGYNTDGFGFLQQITRKIPVLSGLKILIIGSGGVAKAIYHVLNDYNYDITLTARDSRKTTFATHTLLFEKLDDDLDRFDIIINATPVDCIKPQKVKSGASIFDSRYLIDKAYSDSFNTREIKFYDGKEMLLAQGLLSFEIWFPKVNPNYTNPFNVLKWCQSVENGIVKPVLKSLYLDVRKKYYDNPKRLLHIFSMSNTTLKLAKKHHVNLQDARVASLLHDYYRYESEEFFKANIDAQDYSYYSFAPFAYHGFAAAKFFQKEYGHLYSHDAYNAIRNHTIGRVGMTKLEKLIFIADYCEPLREHNFVEEIQKKAYFRIDEAVVQIIKNNIKYHNVKDRQLITHFNAILEELDV